MAPGQRSQAPTQGAEGQVSLANRRLPAPIPRRNHKRVVQEKRKIKGKEVVEEREVVDHKVVVEKVGHRDKFYDE